ncbi:MAG TPA: hypothetical protein VJI66_02740, partial [Candidatus Paceibacterota bacterium]
EINDSFPRETFVKPEPTPTDLKPTLRGIWKGGVSYRKDTISGKVATEFTPGESQEEVVFPSVHNILHWVNKDDPRGPAPSDPSSDSQYENWEYGVRLWFENWKKTNPDFIETNNFTIPTEQDDVHTSSSAPTVTLTLPQKSVFENNERINISISISGKYPIKKSELYINGKFIISNERDPKNLSFIPQDIEGMERKNIIKVVVYDTVYNRSEAMADIEINR